MFLPFRSPHALQLSLWPQGGPMSLIYRGTPNHDLPLKDTFLHFGLQHVVIQVPTFLIRKHQTQERLLVKQRRARDVDEFQNVNAHLCGWSIKRARGKHTHTHKEMKCVWSVNKSKQTLSWDISIVCAFSFSLNNKEHLENYKGYTPQN